ncbi:hypothetical protein WJX74_007039 [Apatococcus lobatus]|uniref:Thioredoxin domain-containing protein n=1 Tax=Apatococcus lobatus TaxID=904363 RepID=A0AAW1QDH1_9CHLO
MAQQIPLQIAIDSDADLEAKLCQRALKVVEVFSEWCGSCKSVLPTLKRIRLDKDDETTLQFLTVCAEATDIVAEAKSHRGKSEPLFLFYRNGVLKHRVEGANTPAIAGAVSKLTPTVADADELENNPFHMAQMKAKAQHK